MRIKKGLLFCAFILTSINAQDIANNDHIPSTGNGITAIDNIYGEQVEFPYEVINGHYMYQGDIVLSYANSRSFPQTKGGILTLPSYRWPNNTIPFVFASGVSTPAKSITRTAANQISSTTNLNVIEISAAQTALYANYLEVTDAEYACWSSVGMAEPVQPINIHSACGVSSAMHEFLHAAGIWHEQSRLDRDDYVTINYSNIEYGKEDNFLKSDPVYSIDVGEYNYRSIMHYSQYAFSKNGYPTIIPKVSTVLGSSTLTAGDIETINIMYPQPSSIASAKVMDYFGNHLGWVNNKYPRLVGNITNDNYADVVGFEYIRTMSATNIGSLQTLVPDANTNFMYSRGWRVNKHPRMLADVNGDGLDDIVGFGNAGTYTALSLGDGSFSNAGLKINRFGYNNGFRTDRHPRKFADVNGDGLDDIIAFGNSGIYVALATPYNSFDYIGLVSPLYSYNTKFRVSKNPRLLGDIDGNGMADIVGFGDRGIFTSLANGGGLFDYQGFVLAEFDYNSGWRVNLHERELTKIDSNNTMDIIGFGPNGTYVATSNGDGTFTSLGITLNQFGYNIGWRTDRHPRLLGDINGDGLDDIVGFADAGIHSATSNGDGTFTDNGLVFNGFGYNDGWRVGKHERYLADIDGDGMDDIVGFGPDGVYIAYANGFGGFTF